MTMRASYRSGTRSGAMMTFHILLDVSSFPLGAGVAGESRPVPGEGEPVQGSVLPDQ